MDEGKYEEAISVFSKLGDYKDARYQITRCRDFISAESATENYYGDSGIIYE